MSTDKTLQTRIFESKSSEETEKLGEQIGKLLKGGEVIELSSDLGGGKTTFVRGLARGMGSLDNVASPTFTLSREYLAGKLRLVHYDFYRLHDPGVLEFELAEVINDPLAVTVVEWAEIVQDVLPARKITIRIQPLSDTSRQFIVQYPNSASFIGNL